MSRHCEIGPGKNIYGCINIFFIPQNVMRKEKQLTVLTLAGENSSIKSPAPLP